MNLADRSPISSSRIQENIEKIGLRIRYQGRVIPLGIHLLAKNDQLATENRAWFAEQRIHVLNLVSSPGSGKTALLEKNSIRFEERTTDHSSGRRPSHPTRRRTNAGDWL